jgi:hypothetical protein
MGTKHLTPAELVIQLFGIRPLADAIGCSPTSIQRWRNSEGGKINPHYQSSILTLAARERVHLTAEELINGRRG